MSGDAGGDGAANQRLDKWLWHARFFKTRSLATAFVKSGKLRVNGNKVAKPHYAVRAGDVLTFPKARDVRVVRIAGLAPRRGPYREARLLYHDLTPEVAAPAATAEPTQVEAASAPPPELPKPPVSPRDRGAGRPTKRERRVLERLRDWIGALRR